MFDFKKLIVHQKARDFALTTLPVLLFQILKFVII